MKIHSRENSFKCHQCERSFTDTNHLQDHVITHMEKSLSCAITVERVAQEKETSRFT